MAVGALTGQPLTAQHAAAYKRRSEISEAAATPRPFGSNANSASVPSPRASKEKKACGSMQASLSTAAGSQLDAAGNPAATFGSTLAENMAASLSAAANNNRNDQPPTSAVAPAALHALAPVEGAPPSAILAGTEAAPPSVNPKSAWWATRRCGGGVGAKCEAKDGGECQSRKAGETAIGWQLDVYWPPDRRWFHAEVISHDPTRGAHEILYPVGSDGGAETEVNVCLGCSRVHLISTTPTPLPWRFDCVCGVHFDHTDGINVDGGTCVQCYNCERWMHGECVSLDGLVRTPAYAHEAGKINAIRGLTGLGARKQLCWLASERQFSCPHCTCPSELAPQTSVHAAPEERVENDSDLEEAEVLSKNGGNLLRIGELQPKLGSCVCVRPMCQFAQSRWGRASGAPAVACAQCCVRMHLHCSLRALRLFHQRCAEAVAAGRECDSLQLLCPRCSNDSPAAAAAIAEVDSSSDEAEGAPDEDTPGAQLISRIEPPPKAHSSRVRLVKPCGACYQCTHSDFYVTCAWREDARYECHAVLIPIVELLRSDGKGLLSEALAKEILAPYGSSPPPPPERPTGNDPRLKIPSSLAPSLLPEDVLRGIVHRVVRAPTHAGGAAAGAASVGGTAADRATAGAGAPGGASRGVSVVVHFDHGAVITLDERTFLRFAREPLAPLLYQSPAVRQLSKLDESDREDPTGGPLRVLKELLRHSNYYHRLEVRETKKMQGKPLGLSARLAQCAACLGRAHERMPWTKTLRAWPVLSSQLTTFALPRLFASHDSLAADVLQAAASPRCSASLRAASSRPRTALPSGRAGELHCTRAHTLLPLHPSPSPLRLHAQCPLPGLWACTAERSSGASRRSPRRRPTSSTSST